MTSHRSSSRGDVAPSRAAQKARTRQALMEAALQLHAGRGLAGVPLREVAKQGGIVPTAFYRHFADNDELGRALAADTVDLLRHLLADVDLLSPTALLQRLTVAVRTHRPALQFLVIERSSLDPPVRPELRMLSHEISVRLARVPQLDRLDDDGLAVGADQLLDAVLATLTGLLDVTGSVDERTLQRAERRLAMARQLLVG